MFGAEKLRVVGDARIEGKLTVTGVIDPTAVILSDPALGTALFFESFPGQTAPVSGPTTGRLRYNNTTGRWQASTQGGAYTDFDTTGDSGWTDDGTLVRLTTITDTVAIGAATMFGSEKVRIVGFTRLEGPLLIEDPLGPTGLRVVTLGILRFSVHDTFAEFDVPLSVAERINVTGPAVGTLREVSLISGAFPSQGSWYYDTGVMELRNFFPGGTFTITNDGAVVFRDNASVSRLILTAAATTIENALDHNGTLLGVYGAAPVAQPTVVGSRAGNAALASLLTSLASQGIVVDGSVA